MGGHDEAAYHASEDSTKETSPSLAVCLVSGGMDSCVTAAIANRDVDQLAFLHISYGQRTEARERRAFDEISDHYAVKQRMVGSLEQLAKIGGSSLTDKNIAVTNPNLTSQQIPTSYVPFRNANFLSVATSWAEVIQADSIYIGAVEEDSSGYPDCRPEFYKAFEQVIALGTKPETSIQIKTPVITLKKSEIVTLGQKLGAPLELTWSCYTESEIACGNCDSCALRLKAFREAGVRDPVSYLLDSKRFAY
jgi:7-cyano-7-deazaguanine synthase